MNSVVEVEICCIVWVEEVWCCIILCIRDCCCGCRGIFKVNGIVEVEEGVESSQLFIYIYIYIYIYIWMQLL